MAPEPTFASNSLMHPDLRRLPRDRAAPASHLVLALLLTLAGSLTACTTVSSDSLAPVVDLPAAPPPPPPNATAAPAAPMAAPSDAVPPPAVTPTHGAVPLLAAALAYAERLRTLSPAELASEQAQIGDPGNAPERMMQLALLLSQTHVPVDTARALGLLQRLSASNAPEAVELRPLARLLGGRLLEARRLEDQADRQAQQLREAQRRIEVLNDRLEAMRAIERSLTPLAPRPGGGRPQP